MGAMMFLPATLAMSRDDIPGMSVYAPPSEQEEVYSIIQNSEKMIDRLNSDGISVVKESIMQVYEACFVEYAETGVLRIEPYRMPPHEVDPAIAESESLDGNEYYAKVVTAGGLFGGNIRFYIKDDVAHSLVYDLAVSPRVTSMSYADHAERIRKLLGKDTFVPTDQVRYVGVNRLGGVFYINDGESEALVVIFADSSVFYGNTGEVVYIGDELREKAKVIAEKHYADVKQYEEWIATYPDRPFPLGGGNIPSYAPRPSSIDHIIDIAAFLGDALTESVPGANLPREREKKARKTPAGVTLGLCLGLLGVCWAL